MESKVKRENFITIQGFMVTDLNLKGNELLIYACIYGFTQAENQTFTGGLQYLADWTNSTKQGVIKCLKSLEEKELIIKRENFINGVKFCEYRTTPLNKVEQGIKQSLTGGVKQSLTNNINENNINNINIMAEQVLNFLNEKAGTHYKPVESNLKYIKARLKDYTEEDLKAVINKKVNEWKGTKMQCYLRAETLFNATKFESYLNGLAPTKESVTNSHSFKQRTYTQEELDALYDSLDEAEL